MTWIQQLEMKDFIAFCNDKVILAEDKIKHYTLQKMNEESISDRIIGKNYMCKNLKDICNK